MKFIIGLGNPGKKYEGTRHNAGFMVVDKLFKKIHDLKFTSQDEDWKKSKKGKLVYFWSEVGGEKVELVKPQKYMNKSGQAVADMRKNHPEMNVDDVYLVHDDLDIILGEFKIQKGKGPKRHNGVESVEQVLGSKEFWRVRVGVENRNPQYQSVRGRQKSVISGQDNNDRSRSLREPARSYSAMAGRLSSSNAAMAGREYVLSRFRKEERELVQNTVDEVVDELFKILGVEDAI